MNETEVNMMDKLKHECPSLKRKEEAIEYIKEFFEYNSEDYGSNCLEDYIDNYEGWLNKLESEYNIIPSEDRVPARTYFLIRERDDKIIGMINIRLTLNEKLKKFGGHIGFNIRPTERKKGYNKINLYLGLLVCQKNGIKEVFMDCAKDNIASAKTILSLGGKLIREYYNKDITKCIVQDYIIDVDKSIEENCDKFKEIVG